MSKTLRAGGEEAQTLYFRWREPTLFDHSDHLTHSHIRFPEWPVTSVTSTINATLNIQGVNSKADKKMPLDSWFIYMMERGEFLPKNTTYEAFIE